MEMKCHVDLALVAGFSQHEHEPRSRLGRQSHIRSTIRQDQSSVKKFTSEVIVSFAATKARSAQTLMVAASSLVIGGAVLERAATIKKAGTSVSSAFVNLERPRSHALVCCQ